MTARQPRRRAHGAHARRPLRRGGLGVLRRQRRLPGFAMVTCDPPRHAPAISQYRHASAICHLQTSRMRFSTRVTPGACGGARTQPRVRSNCRFVLPLIHLIPISLTRIGASFSEATMRPNAHSAGAPPPGRNDKMGRLLAHMRQHPLTVRARPGRLRAAAHP
jgi:hypothetical protein